MQHLIRYASHESMCPLTADLFQTMVKTLDCSDPYDMLVVFWIAIKFEEVCYPEFKVIAAKFSLDGSSELMRKTELRLLLALDYCIPYHTVLREWYNSYPVGQKIPDKVHSFMYAVLFAGVTHLCTGLKWAQVFEDSSSLQVVPLQIVHLLSTIRVMASTPFTAFPKRIKRKLGDV